MLFARFGPEKRRQTRHKANPHQYNDNEQQIHGKKAAWRAVLRFIWRLNFVRGSAFILTAISLAGRSHRPEIYNKRL